MRESVVPYLSVRPRRRSFVVGRDNNGTGHGTRDRGELALCPYSFFIRMDESNGWKRGRTKSATSWAGTKKKKKKKKKKEEAEGKT
mmetsp:Transcript_32712/g.104274  ORF Transcript_32712/g.104274 Transcript_32712/m.104274 type:complete len:86 (-) Transcript_32712:833-1090(-)